MQPVVTGKKKTEKKKPFICCFKYSYIHMICRIVDLPPPSPLRIPPPPSLFFGGHLSFFGLQIALGDSGKRSVIAAAAASGHIHIMRYLAFTQVWEIYGSMVPAGFFVLRSGMGFHAYLRTWSC